MNWKCVSYEEIVNNFVKKSYGVEVKKPLWG